MTFESSSFAPQHRQSSELWTGESHPLAQLNRTQFTGTEGHGTPPQKTPETNINNTNNQKQETTVVVKPTTNIENTTRTDINNKVDNRVDNTNNNNNNNKNENVNLSSSYSDSSSSSSSSSSSNSDARSMSNSSVGNIDNKSSAAAKGGDSTSSAQGGSMNYRNNTFIPASVIPAALPTGGECTVGGTWGATGFLAGFTKGSSKIDKSCMIQQDKHFQQNLDFQQKALDANVALQRDALDKNTQALAQAAKAEADSRANATALEMQRQHSAKIDAVCDAAMKQAETAGKTYDSVDKFSKSKGPASKGLTEASSELARQQAMLSLKMGYACAEASAEQLGVDTSKVPELPPAKIDDKKKR